MTQQSTSEFMATTTPKLDLKGVWCFLSAVKGRYLEGTRGRKERRKNDVIHLNYKYVLKSRQKKLLLCIMEYYSAINMLTAELFRTAKHEDSG